MIILVKYIDKFHLKSSNKSSEVVQGPIS